MQITIKQINGQSFSLQISDSTNIDELKALVSQQTNHPPENMKLVFKGRVLQSPNTISQYNITQNATIILMVTKPASGQPIQNALQNPIPAPAQQAPIANPEQPIQVQQEKFDSQAQQLLVQMGYSRPKVDQALEACQGVYGDALVYLLTRGLPDRDDQNEQDLSFLLNSPEFQQVIQAIRNNPRELENFLAQLESENPELFELITNNQERFLELIGGPSGGERIQLTREEENEIRDLMELGFSANDAIQAYLMCNKNKELAANFLFQNSLG